MKKISLIITVIVLLHTAMQAQQVSSSRDTLPCGMRLPNYYYSHWYDTTSWYLYPDYALFPNSPGVNFIDFAIKRQDVAAHLSSQYVYQQYTDTPIKVRGLWAMVISADPIYRVLDTNRLPEYLCLYSRDTTKPAADYTYFLSPIDSVRWDTARPRMMCLNQTYDARIGGLYCHIYEAYFDTAITLQGEYWIGGTTNSNTFVQNGPSPDIDSSYHEHYPTCYAIVDGRHIGDRLQYNPYAHMCEGRHAHGGGPWCGYNHSPYYGPFGAICEGMSQLLVVPDDTAQGMCLASSSYPDSTYQTITAIPANCYLFSHWDDGDSTNPRTVFLTSDTIFTAHFVPSTMHTVGVRSSDITVGTAVMLERRILHSMDLIPPGEDPLWVRVTGDSTYCAGSPVTFRATATDSRYRFCRWSNGCSDNPMTITVTGDTVITAYFTSTEQYTVSVQADSPAVGHVEGAGKYTECDSVLLMAVADDPLYLFRHWEDSSTANPRLLFTDRDTTLTAYFTPKGVYHVNAESDSPAAGHVEGAGTYYEFDTANLTAVVDDRDYRFSHWSNGQIVNPVAVVVSSDTTLTAYFVEREQYLVSGEPNDPTMGSVSGSGTYYEGDTALLVATPADTAYRLDHWSTGDTAYQLAVAVESDTVVTAYFVPVSVQGIGTPAVGTLFTLTPNPARESVTVTLEGAALPAEITVYDAAGHAVLERRAATRRTRLSTRSLPAGHYFVTVATPRGTATQKLTVL